MKTGKELNMIPETQKRVSANLAALRKAASLSRTQMANILAISRSTYAKYEQGERLPDTATMHNLSLFYCVTIDTLMKSDVQTTLAEYFLHETYAEDEIAILSIFTNLTDFSKGRLVEYGESLIQAELNKTKDPLRNPL